MKAAIISSEFGMYMGLLLYTVYFSLSLSLSLLFFISITLKCYFGAQQIPALGEWDSQAVTKLCHPLQGVTLFLYTVYVYISFTFGCSGLAMVQLGL